MSISLQFAHQFNLLQKFYSGFKDSSLTQKGQEYSNKLKECFFYPKELISKLFIKPEFSQGSTILHGTELRGDIDPNVRSMIDKLVQFAGDANYGSMDNLTNKDPSDPQYVNWETEMSNEEHLEVLKYYKEIIQALNENHVNFGGARAEILYSLITGKKLLQGTNPEEGDLQELQRFCTNLLHRPEQVNSDEVNIELIRKYSHIFIYTILQNNFNNTEKQNNFLIRLTELLNPTL